MKAFFAFALLVFSSLNLLCQSHWAKHPDNPIMMETGVPGDWDETYIGLGEVLYFDNTYHMCIPFAKGISRVDLSGNG